MDKDTAELKRAIGETWSLVKGSYFGEELLGLLDKIEEQAIAKSLRGDTPDSVNSYMESRGKYAAVKQIRTLFTDIEADEKQAINWMAANVAETAPADTASTKGK